jgi:hypothetical protein
VERVRAGHGQQGQRRVFAAVRRRRRAARVASVTRDGVTVVAAFARFQRIVAAHGRRTRAVRIARAGEALAERSPVAVLAEFERRVAAHRRPVIALDDGELIRASVFPRRQQHREVARAGVLELTGAELGITPCRTIEIRRPGVAVTLHEKVGFEVAVVAGVERDEHAGGVFAQRDPQGTALVGRAKGPHFGPDWRQRSADGRARAA